MAENEYRIVTALDFKAEGQRPGFKTVAHGLATEAATLPVPEEELIATFNAGMSAVVAEFYDSNPPEAVGHVRFSPLLMDQLKAQLSLEDCPDIWEMGSGFIDPKIRDQKLYGPLRRRLIEEHLARIQTGEVLILGTTKTPQVLSVLKDPLETIGLPAFFSNHLSFPMISAFTCTCSGEHGQGYQYGPDACTHRVSPEKLPLGQTVSTTLNGQYKPAVMALQDLPNTRMPCCLYMYGKPEVAIQVEQRLKSVFGSPNQLRTVLGSPPINYYR